MNKIWHIKEFYIGKIEFKYGFDLSDWSIICRFQYRAKTVGVYVLCFFLEVC
jgi:hypothetical protein